MTATTRQIGTSSTACAAAAFLLFALALGLTAMNPDEPVPTAAIVSAAVAIVSAAAAAVLAAWWAARVVARRHRLALFELASARDETEPVAPVLMLPTPITVYAAARSVATCCPICYAVGEWTAVGDYLPPPRHDVVGVDGDITCPTSTRTWRIVLEESAG